MSIELTRIIDEPIKNSREKIDGNFQEIEDAVNTLDADTSGEVEVGAHSYPTTIADLETDLGITFDYQTIYQGIETGVDYSEVVDALDSGHKVLYNLQLSDPTGTANLARILSGEYDADITAVAQAAVEDGREIMLVIMHEFNADDYSWAIYKSGNSASDFVAAFQHVVTLWRNAGAVNVKFVQWWNRENTNEDSTPFLTYYAGEDYVDIIAVSQYNRSGVDYTFWHELEHLFHKWYVEVTRATTKPIMFGEMSTSDTNGDKPGWIKDTFRKIKDKYPRVKYVTWFLENKTGGKNWALNTQAEEDAFVEGFSYIKSTGRGEEMTEDKHYGRNIIKPESFLDITKWTQVGADAGTLALSSTIPQFAPYGSKSISITDNGNAGSDFTNEFYQLKTGSGNKDSYNNGQVYTLSFWAKASAAGMLASLGIKQQESPNLVKGWKKLSFDTDWRYYQVSIATDTAATNWRVPDFRLGHNTVAGTIYLYGIKVERGGHATADLPFNRYQPKMHRVVIGKGVECDYQYDGVNLATAINQAVSDATSDGIEMYLQPGDYIITSAVNMNGKSNLHLIGAGIEQTSIVGNGLTTALLNLVNTTTGRFKFVVRDLSVDNTTAAAGSIGISMALLSDTMLENVVIKNCETGLKLADAMYYNNFIGVKIENCTNGIVITNGGTDQPNSNGFSHCKVLNTTNAVTLEYGNQNTFFQNQFENFDVGMSINDIGNTVIGNRFEDNGNASVIFVTLGANAKNNSFFGNYYATDQTWNRSAMIVDGGAGNLFIENNSYKDQFVILNRNLVTAQDYINLVRAGSGNGKALLKLEDTYSNSGTPETLSIRTERAAGYFIRAYRTVTSVLTEFFSVTAQGYMTLQGWLAAKGFLQAVASKTSADSPYTASVTDFLILCDATSGAITVALPTAASNVGRIYVIRKTDTSGNAVTIDPDASETINGVATWDITRATETLTIQSDGSNWRIIAVGGSEVAQIAGLTPSNDDILQRKSGEWMSRTIEQLKADLLDTVVSKTVSDSPYSILTSDQIILVSASGGNTTVTLPTAVGVSGKKYSIKRTDSSANTLTIGTTSSQTIDGDTSYLLVAQYDTITVVSDGANWHII